VGEEASMTRDSFSTLSPWMPNCPLPDDVIRDGVDWTLLPEEQAQAQGTIPNEGMTIEQVIRRPHRKRTPTGHVIRKMLSVR
jgi:hypothetical protein